MVCAPMKWTGTTSINERSYLHLARLAGSWLSELRASPEILGKSPSWSNPLGDEARAVYIVVNRYGKCCYVGQTRPTSRAENVAAIRLGQHMSEPSKQENWTSYWLIPLRADTPSTFVDLLEKRIALRLMIPLRHFASRRTPPSPPRPPGQLPR